MKHSQPNESEDVFSSSSINKLKLRRSSSENLDMSKLNFAEWDSIMDELLPEELGGDEDQDKGERDEEEQDVKAEN
jgi:hypothetical protein